MPTSAVSRSLDGLARSVLTHDHVPPVVRPATPSADCSAEDNAPIPPAQFRSTISTDLVGQLSTIEGHGIRTIDTKYDPSHKANDFRHRGKSMEERHAPTELLRTAASNASHPKTFDAFEKEVSGFYMRIKPGV